MTSSDAQQTSAAQLNATEGEANPTASTDTKAKTAVNIRLLERDYRLAVSEGEKQALVDAAQKLDARMREIRDQGKVHAADRIAIMAALEASLESVKISQQLRIQEQAQEHVIPAQAPDQEALLDQDALLARMKTLSQHIAQALD